MNDPVKKEKPHQPPLTLKEKKECNELLKALVVAQTDIQAPHMDKKGQNDHKYASLHAIYEAIRLPLAQNGLSIQQDVISDEKGVYWLISELSHVSGESRDYKMPVIIDRQGGCHGFVSGLTYARRAAITSLLCLPQDDDDDGAKAMVKTQKKEPQKESLPESTDISLAQLRTLSKEIGPDEDLLHTFLAHARIEKLTDLTADRYAGAMKWLFLEKKKEKANE